MKKGIIVSSALLLFAVAVLLASFVFVLNENEFHNSAVSGLMVEKARWIGDADYYYCFKDMDSTGDYGSYSSDGQTIYEAEFPGEYERPSNEAIFSSAPTDAFADFFKQSAGSFKISFRKNYKPVSKIDSVTATEVRVDFCDPETSDPLDLDFLIQRKDGTNWIDVPTTNPSVGVLGFGGLASGTIVRVKVTDPQGAFSYSLNTGSVP
jgi:hypothetical protein